MPTRGRANQIPPTVQLWSNSQQGIPPTATQINSGIQQQFQSSSQVKPPNSLRTRPISAGGYRFVAKDNRFGSNVNTNTITNSWVRVDPQSAVNKVNTNGTFFTNVTSNASGDDYIQQHDTRDVHIDSQTYRQVNRQIFPI